MTVKLSFGVELQELLQGVVGSSNDCLSEMESDLLQVNLLLMEAINKLGDNVMEIGQGMSIQQQIIDQLTKTGACSPFVSGRFDELRQSVDGNVASVIIAMQFQDITSQLLDRVLSRVRCLQEMLEDIDRLAAGVSGADNEDDVMALIRTVGLESLNKRKDLNASRVRSVMQEHMESGSIDLF